MKDIRRIKRIARHKRIRRTLNGTSSHPRLTVFRSHKEIYAQIIDDYNNIVKNTNYLEISSISTFCYRTYMNIIAILPDLIMQFLQKQNVQHKIFTPLNINSKSNQISDNPNKLI